MVLLRKNALFYRTQHGADVGDLFTSLIHTCDLNQVNSFDYLRELQRHAAELKGNPAQWMPWSYRNTGSSWNRVGENSDFRPLGDASQGFLVRVPAARGSTTVA